jgi:hypothetical protein
VSNDLPKEPDIQRYSRSPYTHTRNNGESYGYNDKNYIDSGDYYGGSGETHRSSGDSYGYNNKDYINGDSYYGGSDETYGYSDEYYGDIGTKTMGSGDNYGRYNKDYSRQRGNRLRNSYRFTE